MGMRTARVKFWTKNGYSKPYNYIIGDAVANVVKQGEWVIVESSRSKYGIGVFDGFEDVTDPDKLEIITKEVVADTDLYEEEEEETELWEGVL